MKTRDRQTARAKVDAKWQHFDPRRQEQDRDAAMLAAFEQLERERRELTERPQ